eukprot:scaffold4516_cov417-Prasinococcus_capsulatus_cf.AAC.18
MRRLAFPSGDRARTRRGEPSLTPPAERGRGGASLSRPSPAQSVLRAPRGVLASGGGEIARQQATTLLPACSRYGAATSGRRLPPWPLPPARRAP